MQGRILEKKKDISGEVIKFKNSLFLNFDNYTLVIWVVNDRGNWMKGKYELSIIFLQCKSQIFSK